MSSEKELPNSTTPGVDGDNATEGEIQEIEEIVDLARLLTRTSISSPSTEERVSAVIERTVSFMTLPVPKSAVTFLPAPSPGGYFDGTRWPFESIRFRFYFCKSGPDQRRI